MEKFKDNKGREWEIEINIASIKKVKRLIDVDLMQSLDGKFLQELSKDVVRMIDTIYVLISAQADAEGVTDEMFGESLAGDAVDAAINAFLDELVNFCPAQKRTLLQTVLTKIRGLEKTQIAAAQTLVDSVEFDEILSQEINVGGSSTNTQELSE